MTDSDNSENSISEERLRVLQAQHLKASIELMAAKVKHMAVMESTARRTLAALETMKADISKYVEAVLNPEQ